MSTSSTSFFKLFPPPAFLTMPHAGLDISDDGIHCIRYDGPARSRRVGLAAVLEFSPGLVDGGDIKDEAEFAARLKGFAAEHRLNRVRVSIPEEKVYLFQTEVSAAEPRDVLQSIEFKLEENVPLSASDALFYYELMPMVSAGGARHASVSVVPKSYIARHVGILKSAGMEPVAFEVAPKAIARAIVPAASRDARIILHSMRRKLGLYVVSGGVVCFTSTTAALNPPGQPPNAEALALLSREIARISSYWMSRDPDRPIVEVLIAGREGDILEEACRGISFQTPVSVRLGNVWENSFDLESYIPPVSRADSLDYAVAAGLAFPLGDRT